MSQTRWRFATLLASTLKNVVLTLAILLGLFSTASAQGRRYYTATGVVNPSWTNPAHWTLNANGGGFTVNAVNPALITQGPGAGQGSGVAQDSVVILEGTTMTMSAGAARTLASVEIRTGGRLIITGVLRHTFGQLIGTGTLEFRNQLYDLPLAVTTSPAAFMGTGGGTVEFSQTALDTIPTTLFGLNYNNLVLSGSNTKIVAGNLTINGNLSVNGTATLQVGNTGGSSLTLTIPGNLSINSTAATAVQLANVNGNRHDVFISGNYAHNTGAGAANWTRQAAQSNSLTPTEAVAFLRFVNDFADQTFTANAAGTYWRIEIDKGSDNTYKLMMTASASSNIVLRGPLDQCGGGNGTAQDATCFNAITFVNGTLELGSGTDLTFSDATNSEIPSSTELRVNGGIARYPGPLVPYGVVRVQSGQLLPADERGISVRISGTVIVESTGTLTTPTIRVSQTVGSNRPSLIITGGVTTLTGTNQNLATLLLDDPNTQFVMTGGLLVVNSSDNNTANDAFWRVETAPSNSSVTGGTVRFVLNNNNANAQRIYANNSFWDVQFVRNSGVTSTASLQTVTALTVQNDLSLIDASTSANSMLTIGTGETVSVGGNLNLYAVANAALPATVASEAEVNFTAGTLAFTGSRVSYLLQESTASNLALTNLTVNKGLDSASVRFYSVAGRAANSVFATVSGTLTLGRGRLDYNAYELNLTGGLTVTATTGQLGFPTSTGRLNLSGAAQTITVPNARTLGIGRLRVAGTGTKTLTGGSIDTVYTLVMAGQVFDLGNNGVYVHNALTPEVAFSATNHIHEAGDAGDTGLSLRVGGTAGAVTATFPIGRRPLQANTAYSAAASVYNPAVANLNFASATDFIRLNIRTLDGPLGTARRGDASPLDSMLTNFWRVSFTQLAGAAPQVSSYVYGYVNADVQEPAGGPIAAGNTDILPGRILASSGARSTEVTANIVKNQQVNGDRTNPINLTFNGDTGSGATPFTIVNADYTAGSAYRFSGQVLTFYSRNATAAWIENGPQTGPGDGQNAALATTWSTDQTLQHAGAAASRAPGAGDIVVIADAHRVALTAVVQYAQLRVNGPNGYLFIEDNGTAGGETSSNLGQVSGDGQILVAITNATWFQFPQGDFSTFNLGNGLYKLYTSVASVTFPATAPTSYPTVVIESAGGNAHNTRTITFPNFPITINRTLWIRRGATAALQNNVTINDTLLVGDLPQSCPTCVPVFAQGPSNLTFAGRLLFPNTGNVSVTVGRKVTLAGTSGTGVNANVIETATGGTASGVHTMTVNGSIEMRANSRINLNGTTRLGDLVMGGNSNAVITGGSGNALTVRNFTVNKGTSASTTLTVDRILSLTGAIDGTTKALTLTNGALVYGPPIFQTLALSSGGSNFSIPSTAALRLTNNVRATIINTGAASSGITLDGELALQGNSTLTMTAVSPAVSSIEYTASGNSRLTFSGGNAIISGQIRRSANNTAGTLRYTQTSGTVYLGTGITNTDASLVTNRAIFDMENNPGSTFSLTGGTLVITRSLPNNQPDLQIDLPLTDANMAAPATIQVGTTAVTTPTGVTGQSVIETPLSTTVLVQTTRFPNLSVQEGAGAVVQQQQVVDLIANGNVDIGNNATLNMNGRNLEIRGNMVVNALGTYNGGGTTTTTFNGTSAQNWTINSSGCTFGNVVINNSAGVNYAGSGIASQTIGGNLTVTAGTLNLGTRTLNVQGNLVVGGSITGNSPGSGRVTMSKASLPVATISGSGTIDNLRIGTEQGVDLASNLVVAKELSFDPGFVNSVLNIGNFRLTLQAYAGVLNAVANANATRYIAAFGTNTSEGVRLEFPAGGSGGVYVLPIGVAGKYTPATYDVTGTLPVIRVRPVNNKAPATTGATNGGINRAIQYYWNVAEASGISSLTQTYTYVQSDVPDNTPPLATDEELYRGGYINNSLGSWIVTGEASATIASTNTATFTDADVDPAVVIGDYTVGAYNGVGDPLELGDVLTLYSSGVNGNFNQTASWWTTPGGPTNPTNPPSPSAIGGAARLVIQNGNTITADQDNLQAFSIDICATCLLDASNFNGQVYNRVTGTGTLRVRPNDGVSVANLPDADYSDFFGPTGGSLTLGSSGTATAALNYNLPATVTTLRNLTIEGVGTRGLAGNVTVTGNLSVTGGTFNPTSQTITLGGNLSTSGTGLIDGTNGTFVLNGTTAQTFTGVAAGTTVYNLTLNNSNGLSIAAAGGDLVVNNQLTLTNGSITGNVSSTNDPDAAGTLRLGSSALAVSGVSNTRRVLGWLQRTMPSGGSYVFPVGTTALGGDQRNLTLSNATAGIWGVRFFRQGFPGNQNGSGANEFTLSNTEFFGVVAPSGGANAAAALQWVSSSNLEPTTLRENLRVAVYNPTGSAWTLNAANAGGSGAVGVASSGTVTSNTVLNPVVGGNTGDVGGLGALTNGRWVSIGAVSTPLPVQLIAFRGVPQGQGVRLTWTTASETNNREFVLERSTDLRSWMAITTVAGAGTTSTTRNYAYFDPFAIPGVVYYRLRQIDFDGKETLSNTIEVFFDGREPALAWNAFPNPTDGSQFSIVVTNSSVDPLEVHEAQVVTSSGQVLYRGSGDLGTITTQVETVLRNSRTGLLFLTLQTARQRQTIRVIRQ